MIQAVRPRQHCSPSSFERVFRPLSLVNPSSYADRNPCCHRSIGDALERAQQGDSCSWPRGSSPPEVDFEIPSLVHLSLSFSHPALPSRPSTLPLRFRDPPTRPIRPQLDSSRPHTPLTPLFISSMRSSLFVAIGALLFSLTAAHGLGTPSSERESHFLPRTWLREEN